MIYSAKLKKMDEIIEEFAYFSIENNDLYCFINCCPMAIEVNKVYNVELDYFIIDEFILEEVNTDESVIIPFERIGNSTQYKITGRLDGNTFTAGNICFEDDALQLEYSYLDGRLITLNVWRLSISVISERI